jgi:hypothetical protein
MSPSCESRENSQGDLSGVDQRRQHLLWGRPLVTWCLAWTI